MLIDSDSFGVKQLAVSFMLLATATENVTIAFETSCAGHTQTPHELSEKIPHFLFGSVAFVASLQWKIVSHIGGWRYLLHGK